MKVVIAGSRDFKDYSLCKAVMDVWIGMYGYPNAIISGCARGADKIGEWWAKEFETEVMRFPADWEAHGKAAGYRRNVEMARECDGAVVFWDGESKGTKHMIDILEKQFKDKVVLVVQYKSIADRLKEKSFNEIYEES